MTEHEKQSITRRLEGVVVSTAMNKTCTVRVSRLKKHSKYLKYYKKDRKFKAHDENEQCKVGDKVFIEETRPMSKEKRWRVVGKVEV